MPITAEQACAELNALLRNTALLSSCGNLLSWDEQTCMPPAGAEHRANQAALLAGLAHDWATAPRVGDLLDLLEAAVPAHDPDSPLAVTVREARREYDREIKRPRRLVEELSRLETLAQQAWIDARKQSDFAAFLPWLEQIVALKREEAQALFTGGVLYDALLDHFEPGMTSDALERLFSPLRAELVPLIAAIQDSPRQPDRTLLERDYPIDAQRAFATAAARKIGFNFEAGRLDEAAHPFCSDIGPGDTRLTTRYNARHFPGAFFGTLHEAGHGIYDQGLDAAAYGLPMGSAVSPGIHESQSRMWENFVGRSAAFWRHFYPLAQAAFPAALKNVIAADFHRAINEVRPSFIRVEADEATYNLHILLRFELERPLISGDLKPADVPAAWNAAFHRDFGMTPPDAAHGCLQDIHWSFGGIGYFPTYTLGNMYAAQFFATARQQLGDLDAQFARGEFTPLRTWLTENIHRRGKQFPAGRLVEIVTGAPLSHGPLMNHLRQKFAPLYDLS